MADDEVPDDFLTFFKALIDPDRLMIAGRLAESEETIESLAVNSVLSRVDVQRHLDRLIEAGLVTAADNVYT
ncbi:MAG: ArsR/SmtB family transcription factor, partial [Anaerolineae bacterium]